MTLFVVLVLLVAANAAGEDRVLDPVEQTEGRGPFVSEPTSISSLPMMTAAEALAAQQQQGGLALTPGGQFLGMAINKGADSLYDPPGDD